MPPGSDSQLNPATDAPSGAEGASLRTLKRARHRSPESGSSGLEGDDPSFRVDLSDAEDNGGAQGSIGALLAFVASLGALGYLVVLVSRDGVEIDETPPDEALPMETAADADRALVPDEPLVVAMAPAPPLRPRTLSPKPPAEPPPAAQKPEPQPKLRPKSNVAPEKPDLASHLAPVDSLLAYQQFGDAIRYVIGLERMFSDGADAVTAEIRGILAEWLASERSPTVHDQEIIAILAERGFEEATRALVIRGAESMPKDAVWTRAAAVRGHVESMLRLAERLEGGDAKNWYRRAAQAGSQKAISWCERNGVDFSGD